MSATTRLDIQCRSSAVPTSRTSDIAISPLEGATLANCVEITGYLVDMNDDFAGYNAVWAEYFGRTGHRALPLPCINCRTSGICAQK